MVEFSLKNMYSHEFEKIVEQEMEAPIKHLEKELVSIRTGRAHPSMVEDIKVTCYGGSQLSIKELAAISTPDARLIMIQPWDASTLADIEKGILAGTQGFTPANDGNVLRIQLPEISSQRREELVKSLSKKKEDAKDSVRAIRGDVRNKVKDSERKHEIAEDFSLTLQNLLQKIHDKYIEKIEQMCGRKEKDLKAV